MHAAMHETYNCTNHHATICGMHETYVDIIHSLNICFIHCGMHVWLYLFQDMYVSCIAACMKQVKPMKCDILFEPGYNCTNHHATVCVMHKTYVGIIHRLNICFMHCGMQCHACSSFNHKHYGYMCSNICFMHCSMQCHA